MGNTTFLASKLTARRALKITPACSEVTFRSASGISGGINWLETTAVSKLVVNKNVFMVLATISFVDLPQTTEGHGFCFLFSIPVNDDRHLLPGLIVGKDIIQSVGV